MKINLKKQYIYIYIYIYIYWISSIIDQIDRLGDEDKYIVNTELSGAKFSVNIIRYICVLKCLLILNILLGRF